ncbi:CPBP family intramembrane metalloprotease [Brevibacterium sp. JNUCC-42]|nr:CPBP family intramembrane metalloprotease [Brevibacterium sp. JNUCC-42]
MKTIVYLIQVIAKKALAIMVGFLISIFLHAIFPASLKDFSQVGMLIGVWIIYWLFERKHPWPLGFRTKGSWKKFVMGIGVGACTIILSCILIWLLGGVQIKRVQTDVYILVAILSTIPKWIMVAVIEEMTGNLWIPIGAHFIWNFLQSALGFAVSGDNTESPSIISVQPIGDTMLSGGSFGAEGSYLTACISLIALNIAWRRYQKKKMNAASSL